MFEVEIKDVEVHIRIKNPIGVKCVVRKGDWHFSFKETVVLLNGKASFTKRNVFFISKEKSDFEIEVVLEESSEKHRFAGKSSVNLKDYK